MCITHTHSKTSPPIPLPTACLAKVLKGVFGLADAPRQWWLKLAKSLESLGWVRSSIDQACWFLWDKVDPKKLRGVIVSHVDVDNLLFGGDSYAEKLLMRVGEMLGFREVQRDSFVWCGKRFHRRKDGAITLSMVEYHDSLKAVYAPKPRRAELDSALSPSEHKQLRALLGSFQWLVAQVRFDMAFQVSSLQGEKPTVSTLLRANVLCRELKATKDFELVFRPVNPFAGGVMVVTDSSLGNVTVTGSAAATPLEKVFSQSCYYVLLADEELMRGRPGSFNVLDMRSHRIPRVCRSSYSAETLGAEEAFDVGQLCRGFMASLRGLSLQRQDVDRSLNSVGLTVVVDAKDVHDKANSDTSSFGSQKSLAFTVAWLRAVLRRSNTTLRWTSTENMWVDAGTKEMDPTHLRKILAAGHWSVEYSPNFLKQVSKGKSKSSTTPATCKIPGEPLVGNEPVMGHLLRLGEFRGWHQVEGMGVNVTYDARSFRTPEPRFAAAELPLRTSFGRFTLPSGQCQWRCLERCTEYAFLHNQHSLLEERVPILVTFFMTM